MRYLILSDIHANQEALSAVLSHVRRKRIDRTVFLGDLVGYGANPNQTIEKLRSMKQLTAIRGNHDKVCSGIEDGKTFNRLAYESAMWTRNKLTPANRKWLIALPQGPRLVDDTFAISHGTPVDEDAYLFGELEAYNIFEMTDFPICFFGHSHFPVVFAYNGESITTVLSFGPTMRVKLLKDTRYLINPGSIGQPRDGNPLASFALFDSKTRMMTIQRVAYHTESAQEKILRAGLPRPLADRLAVGR